MDTQHPEYIVGRVYWSKVPIIKEVEGSKFLWRPKSGEHTFTHVRGTVSPQALMLPCTLTSVPFQPLALFHIQNPYSLIFITLSTWSFQFTHGYFNYISGLFSLSPTNIMLTICYYRVLLCSKFIDKCPFHILVKHQHVFYYNVYRSCETTDRQQHIKETLKLT